MSIDAKICSDIESPSLLLSFILTDSLFWHFNCSRSMDAEVDGEALIAHTKAIKGEDVGT